jgi:hypothetical protein
MGKSREQVLTEAMGGCWHETAETQPYHDGGTTYICKCGARDTMYEASFSSTTRTPWSRFHGSPDFSSWAGFGQLWEWAKQQDWWADFMSADVDAVDFFEELINPGRFADAVVNELDRLALKH